MSTNATPADNSARSRRRTSGPERRDRTGPHWWMEAHAHYGTAMWNLARARLRLGEGRRGGDRAAMHAGERRDEDWPGFLSPGGNDQQFQGLLPRVARARRITGPSPY